MSTENQKQMNFKEVKNTLDGATGFIIRFREGACRFPTLYVRQSDIKLSECEQFLVIAKAMYIKDAAIVRYIKRTGRLSCDKIDILKTQYYSTMFTGISVWVATNTIIQMEEFGYDWYLKTNYYTEKQYTAYCRRINAIARRSGWLALKLYREDSHGWTPQSVRYGFITDKELYDHVNHK